MNDPCFDPVWLHMKVTNELARVQHALRNPAADYGAIYSLMTSAMQALETLRIVDARAPGVPLSV